MGKQLIDRLHHDQLSLGVTRVVCADVKPSGAGATTLDVTDGEAVQRAVSALRPDTVFHLAAVVDIRPEAGEMCAPVNTEGTRHIITAAAAVGASIVHCSTHDVTFNRVDESNVCPRPPQDLQVAAPCRYASSKAAGEHQR